MSDVTDLIARAREIMEFSEDAQLIGELARELEKAQPRIITTAEELDALPEGSIILTPSTNPNYPSVFRKVWRGEWLELDPGDKSDGEYGIVAEGLLRWDSKDHTATILFAPKEETK